jgi:hypothetical protein
VQRIPLSRICACYFYCGSRTVSPCSWGVLLRQYSVRMKHLFKSDNKQYGSSDRVRYREISRRQMETKTSDAYTSTTAVPYAGQITQYVVGRGRSRKMLWSAKSREQRAEASGVQPSALHLTLLRAAKPQADNLPLRLPLVPLGDDPTPDGVLKQKF